VVLIVGVRLGSDDVEDEARIVDLVARAVGGGERELLWEGFGQAAPDAVGVELEWPAGTQRGRSQFDAVGAESVL
jgi:hypothetical protein